MLTKLLVLLLLLGDFTLAAAQQVWVRRSDFAFPARIQAVAFSVGEKGYVASGISGPGGVVLQDLQEYDPATRTWRYRASLPVPLRGAAAFTIGRKAYVTTGAGTSVMNHRLFVWDQDADSWTNRAPFPAGGSRMAAVGISYGNRGFIGTGYDLAERALNDFWEYNPFSDSWIRKADLPGSGRCYAAGFTIHDKIYIGLGNNGSAFLKDWWEYDPSTDSWRRMPDLPGEARSGAMGFAVNGMGYIVGGVNMVFQPLQDVWEFDPVQGTWEQVAFFGGSARAYGNGFTIGSTGYVAAGASVAGYLSELWEGSPVAMVRQIPKEEVAIEVYPVIFSPNPFFYRFFMKMRHPYTGLLELTITDLSGRVVFRQHFNKDAAYVVNCWEIDYLPDGLFIFRVRDASGVVDYRQTLIHKSFGI